MSTPNKVLTALANANGYVALGLQVGEVVIPLVKGAIQEIRTIATGVETVDYVVLVKVDGQELDSIDTLAVDDLTAINAEFAKRGVAQVPLPGPTSATS